MKVFPEYRGYPLVGLLASLAVEESVLNYAEKHGHPYPRVQRKMEALWLKSQGVAW